MGKGGSATGGGTDAAMPETGSGTNWAALGQGLSQALTQGFGQSPTAFPAGTATSPVPGYTAAAPAATGAQSALERRLLFMQMLANQRF